MRWREFLGAADAEYCRRRRAGGAGALGVGDDARCSMPPMPSRSHRGARARAPGGLGGAALRLAPERAPAGACLECAAAVEGATERRRAAGTGVAAASRWSGSCGGRSSRTYFRSLAARRSRGARCGAPGAGIRRAVRAPVRRVRRGGRRRRRRRASARLVGVRPDRQRCLTAARCVAPCARHAFAYDSRDMSSDRPYSNVLEMIGNTPLMAVRRIDTGPCRAVPQAREPESGRLDQGPRRAVSDRGRRARRRLKPGGTLIEATAGNTGLGLALVAAQKGYRLLLVIPDKMSQEKIFHLKAMGAEVVLTRSDVSKGHPEYYRDVAERLAARDAQRLLRQPVRQPRQPAGPRGDHRARDLGADGPQARCGRVRRRHRRHAHRALALFRAHRAAASRWCWPIRSARSWRSLREHRQAAGEDDAVAGRGHRRRLHSAGRRLLARRPRPTAFPMPRPSRPAASCSERRASSPARPPARCWPPRCATAASRSSRSASSPSSATAATSTSPRSTTTTGCSTRASSSASRRRPARPDRAPRTRSAPRSP